MDDFNNIPTGSWIDLLGNGHRYIMTTDNKLSKIAVTGLGGVGTLCIFYYIYQMWKPYFNK